MTIRKIVFIVFCFIICSLKATAQNTGGIKGLLRDSSGKQVLSLATITVFRAKDTSIVTYRLSDPSGNFKIPGLPLEVSCRALVSFSGYKVYRKDFLLTKEVPQLDLGTILLINDPQNLDEVVVMAERPPVSVRKDTIEFNASAFKTIPSAVLEDLLKKLPGVDVDPDGNIRVKGKQVNKLLVDGKNFFGGDPQIATKNLPANIVDKVQVMNDKEEMDRNPDIPESEIGQVINIKLKRAIKKGWFGKAYAGKGTDNRHEAGAIVNIFRDTTQVSVLGYSNNINKPGFGINDIQKIGGFARSGINSISVMGDGGYSINGSSFGGTGQGLQRSTGGGVNFNNQFGKKVTLNLQYFYGQINSNYNTLSNQQRFTKDTILSTLSNRNSETISKNHRIGGTLKWTIDSLTTLTFRPGVTFTNNISSGAGNSFTDENFRGNINKSITANNGNDKISDYSHNLYIDRAFKKKGRNLSFTSDFSIADKNNKDYNDGIYTIYNFGLPEDSLLNQLRHTGGNTLRTSAAITFSNPINKKTTLRLTHRAEYLKENNDINFFNKDFNNGKYEKFNNVFSNGISRDGWKNTSTASLSYRNKKFSFTPGLNFLTIAINNRFSKNPELRQRFNFIYPSLGVGYGPFNLNYSAYVQEPPASELQEVIDVSNRFYQQFGNPNLKPSLSHNVNLRFYKYTNSYNSFQGNLSLTISDNAIMWETTIDKNAIRTTRPVNINGTYRTNGFISYSYQYKVHKNFTASLRPSVFVGSAKNKISINNLLSGQNNFNVGPAFSVNFNYKDKIEVNQRYSLNYRKTTYDNKIQYRDIEVVTHTLESEVIIRMPKHVVWENLINYRYNPQVAQGFRKNSVRWNAGVSYLFLKEDKGQFKLSVFDLLKQNINVTRSTGENYLSDTQSTTLTRYFMLSFIYNLRTFSSGKVGGRDRSMFLF